MVPGANQGDIKEPWIQSVDFAFEGGIVETDAGKISGAFVRMVVSTTLACVTSLSQLAFDAKTGRVSSKRRTGGDSSLMEALVEIAEEKDVCMDSRDGGPGLLAAINSDAGGMGRRRTPAPAGGPVRLDFHKVRLARMIIIFCFVTLPGLSTPGSPL